MPEAEQMEQGCLHKYKQHVQRTAICKSLHCVESHFDGRRIILQRQFSNWKGEEYSCSSPGTVTKWVPHSHCALFGCMVEVAPPDNCVIPLHLIVEGGSGRVGEEKGLAKTRHTV